MSYRILHVVSNVDTYGDDSNTPTGLWLSELTHAWDVFDQVRVQQDIASPRGGNVPLEPRSTRFPLMDQATKEWHDNEVRAEQLQQSLPLAEIDPDEYDAVYFTGGRATLFDFPDNTDIHRISRDIYEAGKIVSSVCHGFCAFLNVTLSTGQYLLEGKKMTGFTVNEEKLSGVDKLLPLSAETVALERGATFRKSTIPFTPFVVADRNLITGQNPFSTKATAQKIVEHLVSNATG